MRNLIRAAAVTVALVLSALAAPAALASPAARTVSFPTNYTYYLQDNYGTNYYGCIYDTGHGNLTETEACNGALPTTWGFHLYQTVNGINWYVVENVQSNGVGLCWDDVSGIYYNESCPSSSPSTTQQFALYYDSAATTYTFKNRHDGLNSTAANFDAGSPIYSEGGGPSGFNEFGVYQASP